ncbi:craniofacial development protein 2-like [Saccostrea cucullata]|uniref:craniofacial development protein 2-like n=1 Tax=Saccostrea cuccullata TaxID=36930 RepID=UPI002ED31D25
MGLLKEVCYSPTEDKEEEEEKDSFYEELQRAVEETPVHDILIILGDLNAKIGTNNKGKESIMGKHGCGVINNNGSRLEDFCLENKLVIGGTIFQHKNIHKLTWTSPDGHTQNQIDHVLINKRWRGTLQDVRALRGADVGSDHTLVLVKLKLKLEKIKKGEQRSPQVDVSKLKDPALMKSFQLEVKNRFTILKDEQELSIEQFNTTLAGKKTLGLKRKKKEEWISSRTWEMVELRCKTKKKIRKY